MSYHLAQLNIAQMKYSLEDSAMHGFVSRIDEINALAEESPGFVWRLKGDNDNATAIRVFEDPTLIINMSVWESLETLRQFTYNSRHREVMRQRKKWFEHPKVYMAMWWVPIGHFPNPQEAREKLEFLNNNGATHAVFTFRHPFPMPDV